MNSTNEYRFRDMAFRLCGQSGLKLPLLSLGLWQNFGGDSPSDTSRAIVRRAFELRITHFDLANNYGPPYGSAEQNFGRLLATDLMGHRDELVISTKAGYDMWEGPYGEGGSRKYLLASLDQSLRRMGLEYERVTSALIGASSVAQLEQNVAALVNRSFTPEELAERSTATRPRAT